jgi:TRAP-type transport system small permease protein
MLRTVVAAISRVNGVIERVLSAVAGLLLVVFTMTIFIDVVFRQLLGQPLMWPSEWALITFVWSVMLAAAVAAAARVHFVVEIIADKGSRFHEAVFYFSAVCAFLVAFIAIYFGWRVAEAGMRQYSPMLGYRLVYTYAAFPLFGGLLALFTAEHVLRRIAGLDNREYPELQLAGSE